jgi:MFS family permease
MTTLAPSPQSRPSVFKDVTFYHWLVVIIASAGWLFDCMDQRLFTVAKESALKELLGSDAAAQAALSQYLNYAIAAMMIGWGTGGLFFGMLSDKWGRVKTMVATLVVYSSFTGLSGFAQTWVDFTLYRFLVGLGVGGMFGAATTLVAESVPGGFRSLALGSLQALSATGNITGTIISMRIQPGADNLALGDFLGMASASGWRLLFFVGILPALLIVPIVFFLREPEQWKKARAEAKSGNSTRQVGSPLALFRHPRWRKNTFVGLGLGVSGMVGLWGIGFFSPELVTSALQHSPLREADVTRPSQVVVAMRDASQPAAQWIWQRISPEIQVKLAQVTDTNASLSELVPSLTVDLNRIISGPNIYESNAFRSVSLKKNILNLIRKVDQTGSAADVAFLNRQLLEQVFPGAISSIQRYIDAVRSRGLLLQDIGSLTGMMVFTMVASYLNRRKAFAGAFVLCLVTTAYVFNSLRTEADVYWMLPMMGFAQLALFAGYSIYFPELYPTRLRGTGVGFCYNVVRFLTVPFNLIMGWMSTWMPFRSAAIIMSMIYLIGLVSLIWAPETKDQPLPED